MPPRPVSAAGGVVYREGYPDTGPQFLLVHRSRYRDWSLPKGKVDSGESFEDAADREVVEETGLNCDREEYLGAVSYRTQRSRTKLVKYWLMKTRKGTFIPNLEVDKVEWVGINGALSLLTYNRDARLIERAYALLQNRSSARLYLVRHGNAGVRSTWKGPDKKRPLTEKGRQQAVNIAELLARHPVSELRSSPALRCVQTLEPFATTIQSEISTTKKLKENVELDTIYDFIGTLPPGALALGAHKDWIARLIEDLDRRRVHLRGARRWPKASIWVLDVVDGEVAAGYYAGRGSIPAR
jgi:phosphohistidine phosphatase SixA/8-oxo-dGTP pyrophosphatase MutT (NUDIX family)